MKTEAPKLRITRTARTATATAELSSLKPSAPRGVDARSLASAPPPFLKITRELTDTPDRPQRTGQSGGRGGGFVPRGQGNFVPRGQGSFTPRGPGNFAPGGRGNFTPRGRGGAGGRGRGGVARGRGGPRGGGSGGRKRPGRDANDDMWADTPLTAAEQAYKDARDMGVLAPARVGLTTMQSLETDVPALATSTAPIGLVETIRDHVRKLTGQHGNQLIEGDEHGRQYAEGNGTLFVNDADLESVVGQRHYRGTPTEYTPVPENEREAIMNGLVAGQYPNVSPAMANDTLGGVEATANKNPTYLPQNTAELKAKVQALLPTSRAKTGAPKKAAARA